MRWLREDRKKNSPSTINHRVGTLSQLFDLAASDDLVLRNPCRLISRPRAGESMDRIARSSRRRTAGSARPR